MTYSTMHFDTSGLPAGKEFLADIVADRAAAKRNDTPGAFTVTFRRDSQIAPESFSLTVEPARAAIAASDFRGFLYGAGEFLRGLEYRQNGFEAPERVTAQSPARPIRIAYFARHFHNWYEMADAGEIQRYIEDLALWGVNCVLTISIPVYNLTTDLDGPDFQAAVTGFRRIAEAVCRLDLMLGGAPVGGNQTFKDAPERFRGVPNTDPRRGNLGFNLCPAQPGALEWFDARFDELMAAMADGPTPGLVVFWPFDEGGCECPQCRPWGGNGYLKLAGHLMARYRAVWPQVKFCLSTWTFHDDEWELLDEALRNGFPIDWILADSHEEFPRYPLEHSLSGVPLITFPEISMWGRHPWGGGGATPQPERFRRLFDQVAARASGFMYYSEGLFEDLNKLMVQRFYWDDAPADATVAAYARYYFPGCDPADLVRLCHLFEANHAVGTPEMPPERRDEYRARALEALALTDTMDQAILPRMRGGWRWRILLLRAVIDVAHFEPGGPLTPEGVAAMRELIRIYKCSPSKDLWDDPQHNWVRPPLP